NRAGGPTCHYNAVDADALALAVVRKLRERLYNPLALEAIRAEVRRADALAADPRGSLAALEARLAILDRKLDPAARRVLEEEDDALVPALRRQLQAAQQEHDALAQQVEALRHQGRPAGDLEAGVEEAMALMGRLEQAVNTDDQDMLRGVLE